MSQVTRSQKSIGWVADKGAGPRGGGYLVVGVWPDCLFLEIIWLDHLIWIYRLSMTQQ